jgi:hypothetical protein
MATAVTADYDTRLLQLADGSSAAARDCQQQLSHCTFYTTAAASTLTPLATQQQLLVLTDTVAQLSLVRVSAASSYLATSASNTYNVRCKRTYCTHVPSTSATPTHLRYSTVLARFVLRISGTISSAIAAMQSRVYSL